MSLNEILSLVIRVWNNEGNNYCIGGKKWFWVADVTVMANWIDIDAVNIEIQISVVLNGQADWIAYIVQYWSILYLKIVLNLVTTQANVLIMLNRVIRNSVQNWSVLTIILMNHWLETLFCWKVWHHDVEVCDVEIVTSRQAEQTGIISSFSVNA